MPRITVIWYGKYRFDKQCAIAQELFKEIFVVLARMRMSTEKKEEGTHSFIGDFSKLEEKCGIPEGQSGLCRAAKNFRDYLDGVSEKTSVIGYVGPFGTGKSAVLEILDPREIFLRSKKEEEKKKEEKVMKGLLFPGSTAGSQERTAVVRHAAHPQPEPLVGADLERLTRPEGLPGVAPRQLDIQVPGQDLHQFSAVGGELVLPGLHDPEGLAPSVREEHGAAGDPAVEKDIRLTDHGNLTEFRHSSSLFSLLR